ncbi:MAG: NADH oxidase [Flavobacteriales bacterium]|nr:NADH oxidase [Flavobacteriales bacterium]|tara:strand:- start:345 stop:647 length:303 start_codon:yes stop_codon:yes gene_type:complete
MQEISIKDFLKIDKNNLQVIDVREQYEYENGNIDAINIPMDEILQSTNRIQRNKQVVIYCQSGRRAAAVVYMLKKEFNIENVFNLSGGYTAYLELISNQS